MFKKIFHLHYFMGFYRNNVRGCNVSSNALCIILNIIFDYFKIKRELLESFSKIFKYIVSIFTLHYHNRKCKSTQKKNLRLAARSLFDLAFVIVIFCGWKRLFFKHVLRFFNNMFTKFLSCFFFHGWSIFLAAVLN